MCIYRPLRGGKDEAPRMIAANGGTCTNRPCVCVTWPQFRESLTHSGPFQRARAVSPET